MRILVDENIPRMTVVRLREPGHDVKDIRGTTHQGLADPDLWDVVPNEQRLLISTDKGFTQYREVSHHGILIVRLRQPNRKKVHDCVMHALGQFRPASWPGLLIVMRDTTQSVSRTGGPMDS